MRREHEHIEQRDLITWSQLNSAGYPVLARLYAIPNGGQRNKSTAGKLRAEGVKAGVPDLCLPVPSAGHHSLYIEMKAGRNRPTELQREWLDDLARLGHKTAVCYSWVEAAGVICDYLGLTRLKANLGK